MAWPRIGFGNQSINGETNTVPSRNVRIVNFFCSAEGSTITMASPLIVMSPQWYTNSTGSILNLHSFQFGIPPARFKIHTTTSLLHHNYIFRASRGEFNSIALDSRTILTIFYLYIFLGSLPYSTIPAPTIPHPTVLTGHDIGLCLLGSSLRLHLLLADGNGLLDERREIGCDEQAHLWRNWLIIRETFK